MEVNRHQQVQTRSILPPPLPESQTRIGPDGPDSLHLEKV